VGKEMKTLNSKTPLFDKHKDLGAYISGFGGFLMPILYTSAVQEHLWCRQSCAVFDTAHMGQFLITGKTALQEVNNLVITDIRPLADNRCRYTVMLNASAGIIDDLILYKINKDKFMLVVNSGTRVQDEEHIKKNLREAEFLRLTPDYGKIDVQGPQSRKVLEDNLKIDLRQLRYFSFDYFVYKKQRFLISRTGYTGELGYEIYIEKERLGWVWDILLSDSRVKPAGLAARDTLRLEAGLVLYGQDINDTVNPWQAGLERFIDLNKKFIGREELIKQKNSVDKRLSFFVSDSKQAPRHNYRIFSYPESEEIGVVTSGTYSPLLKAGIGSGYIKKEFSQYGTGIKIKGNNRVINACIARRPVSNLKV
jgi:aminomethyltransferase